MPERAGEEMVFELRRRRLGPGYVRPFVMLKNVVIRGQPRQRGRSPRRGRPATGLRGAARLRGREGREGAKGSRDYGERPVGWRRRWAARAAFLLGAFALGATRGEAFGDGEGRRANGGGEEPRGGGVREGRRGGVRREGRLELDKEKGGAGGGRTRSEGSAETDDF